MNREKLPLVSVIVPVFNSEKYIVECLDSLKKQEYENIEVIIIDDGSTDNSPLLIEKHIKSDRRFIYKKYDNNGLSVARNRGLSLSTGELIFFLDSDDYLSLDCIKMMVREQDRYNADIVMSSPALVGPSGESIVTKKDFILECNLYKGEALLEKLSENWVYVVSWGKLFRKSLFQRNRFIPKKQHEDEFIIHHLLINSNSVRTISNKFYFYRQHSNSIMYQSNLYKRLDFLEAMNDRYALCRLNKIEKGELDVAKNVVCFCRPFFSIKKLMTIEKDCFEKLIVLLEPWKNRKALLIKSSSTHCSLRATSRKILYLARKKSKFGIKKITLCDIIVLMTIDIIRVIEKFCVKIKR